MAEKKPKKTKKESVSKHEIVVKVQSESASQGLVAITPKDLAPEVYKGKYSLVPTRLTEIQLKAILVPTPKNIIKSRPGKGGGDWDFIPGWWFKKRLNFVFGFDGWDTLIDGERIDGDFITVKGRLIIHDAKTGKDIVSKADYGGAEIKYKKGTKNYLNLPNDFKAAQTDLVKRCCVQLGMAMDVYGKSESKEVGQYYEEKPALPAVKKDGEHPVVEAECHECGNPITKAEAEFSKKIFKKPLCRQCQAILKQQQ